MTLNSSTVPAQMSSPAARPQILACPVCKSKSFRALFATKGSCIELCRNCGLALQNPQPSDVDLAQIYGAEYFIGSSGNDGVTASQFEVVKRATARLQLDEIGAYLAALGRLPGGLRLLEIGCGHGNMLFEARARGFEVEGLEFSGDATAIANRNLGRNVVKKGSVGDTELATDQYNVCVAADVIEHVRDPDRFLTEIFRILKNDGVLFIATPNLGSLSARLLGRHWMEFKREHLYYFNRDTIKALLTETGFRKVVISDGKKVLTPEYIIGHFDKFPVPIISSALRFARSLTPSGVLQSQMKITASGINVFATKL